MSLKVRVLPARSRDQLASASSAGLPMVSPFEVLGLGLVKVQAGFQGSQAVTQSLPLACKVIAAGFGKEFFPPHPHSLTR